MMQSRTMRVRGLGHAGTVALVAGTVFGLVAPAALAAPQGEQVVRGSAQFTRDGATTTIRAANGAVINYSSFDVAAHETVRFIQPGAQSRVLNRVNSPLPTQINGSLLANGQVFIVNPAGVMFGANSVVNVGQLFAAAGDIANADFAAGVNRFSNVQGGVVAQGFITADAVHLIGSSVANHGAIVSPDGLVTMTVGDEVLLREKGGRVSVVIDGRTVDHANPASDGPTGAAAPATRPAVENTGSIETGRGRITLAAGDAVSIAVRNAGRLSAQNGQVHLDARSGRVENDGAIDVRAGHATLSGPMVVNRGAIDASANNGRVHLRGHHGALLGDGASITVGDHGHASVSAAGGDAALAAGSTIDAGHGATVTLAARNRVAAQGAINGGAGGSLQVDPTNLTISTDGANDDQFFDPDGAARNDGDFFVSAAAVEGFQGDVSLAATNDVFVLESIDKNNGGLALTAGDRLVFGDTGGSFTIDLAVSADFIDFSAGSSIVDAVVFETAVEATQGDVTLQALDGEVGIFSGVRVPTGRTVTLRQRDTRVLEASGAASLLLNPLGTNLVVEVTGGDLLVGGQFAGQDEPSQRLLGFDVSASRDVVFDDSVQANAALRVAAGRDIVFGREPTIPAPPGGFTQSLTLDGATIDLVAGRDVRDFAIFGAQLVGRIGDVSVEATTGSIAFDQASLLDGRTLRLTQAQDMFLLTSGPNGVLANPDGTNLVVDVTAGDLTIGGAFDGFDDAAQRAASLNATASGDVTVNRDVLTFGDLNIAARGDVRTAEAPTLPQPPGGFTQTIALQGADVNVSAGGSIVDNTVFGATYTATSADVTLLAETGSVNIGQATVDDGRFVRITQAQTRLHDARVLGNGRGTNLRIDVTDGDLVFGAEFAGDGDPPNLVRSVIGTAAGDVRTETVIDATQFAELVAQNDVLVGADLIAGDRVELHAALAGSGAVRFENADLRVGAERIVLRAAQAGGVGSGFVDARSASPTFTGASADANPASFSIVQDAAIDGSATPLAGQWAAGSPAGVMYLLESRGGDVDLTDGAGFAGSFLTVRTPSGADGSRSERAILQGGFDLGSLRVDSNARIGDAIATTNGQTYLGTVVLLSDATLNGGDVRFAQTIDAASALQQGLRSDADMTFGGEVGGRRALAFLLIDGDARIDGGLVRTGGDQSYGGEVLLGQDTQLLTLVDGSVLFGGEIDAAAGAGSVDLDVVATEGGLIVFGGDVGGDGRLGELRLSTAGSVGAGPSDVPDRATIGARDDVRFVVSDFLVNQNEKITVLGDLVIDAAGVIRLGDASASGNIVLDGAEIVLLRRPGGPVLRPDGTVVQDQGVDIGAGGAITLNGEVRLGGDATGRDPVLGARNGVFGDVGGARSVSVRSDFGEREQLVLTDGGDLLDLRVIAGVTPIDVESQLIDQLPDTPEFEDSVQLGVQDIIGLRRLGLAVRTVEGDEATAGVGGRMLLSDLPTDIVAYDAATPLAAARFDVDAVRALVSRYEAIFGPAEADTTAAVAAQVRGLAAAYLAETGAERVDGEAFAAWVAERADRADAVALAQLGAVLDGIRGLGLTDREYADARLAFAGQIADETPLSARELAEALEALELVALVADEEEASDAA